MPGAGVGRTDPVAGSARRCSGEGAPRHEAGRQPSRAAVPQAAHTLLPLLGGRCASDAAATPKQRHCQTRSKPPCLLLVMLRGGTTGTPTGQGACTHLRRSGWLRAAMVAWCCLCPHSQPPAAHASCAAAEGRVASSAAAAPARASPAAAQRQAAAAAAQSHHRGVTCDLKLRSAGFRAIGQVVGVCCWEHGCCCSWGRSGGGRRCVREGG